MGISSLQNYVQNQGLNIPHRLRDTKLIIDGNSFSKYLFYFYPMEGEKKSYFCGGHYAHYKVYVRKFLENFVQCNVQPIVVFDGGSKMDLDKDTRVQRVRAQFEYRLKKAIVTCTSRNADLHKFNINWPSISTVLFQVLRDLNIAHVQCATLEADDVIPVIARYYHCPVLALDSDFLLWDLPDGVISMYRLFKDSTNACNTSSGCIDCTIYYYESGLLAHLKSSYGFKPEMLPLVGPLLGYDQVDRKIAIRFTEHAMKALKNKFKIPFETKICFILNKFSTHFRLPQEKAIVKRFENSILGKLLNSFKHFSSISEHELKQIEHNFQVKLDEITLKLSLTNEMSDLDEIERNFIGNLIKFEKTIKTENDSLTFDSKLYDRILSVFRWLSSQNTLEEATNKLTQFSSAIKTKNAESFDAGFVDADFDLFIKHINEELPISLFYESLESKIRMFEPDLPIEQFLNEMYNDFFPQVQGIPLKLHRGLVQGIVNPRLLNILCKVDLCPALIEDYEISSSSFSCVFDLNQYLYGIIFNQDEEHEVTRIYREEDKQIEVQIKPVFKINGKRLPNLEQISNMPKKDRRDLLFVIIQKACFTCEVNIDELIDKMQQVLPSQCQSVVDAFLLMTLSLIMCNHKCHTELTHSPKWNPFLRAMLANIFFLGYIGPSDSDIPTFFSIDQDQIDLLQIKQVPSSTVDLTINHYFNSYHNCLQSLNFLIQLLNLYECFELDRFVCGLQGSFVHAITQLFGDDQYFDEFTKRNKRTLV